MSFRLFSGKFFSKITRSHKYSKQVVEKNVDTGTYFKSKYGLESRNAHVAPEFIALDFRCLVEEG